MMLPTVWVVRFGSDPDFLDIHHIYANEFDAMCAAEELIPEPREWAGRTLLSLSDLWVTARIEQWEVKRKTHTYAQ